MSAGASCLEIPRLYLRVLACRAVGGTKKCMGCMEAYESVGERMEAYGMVKKVYRTGIKGVWNW